MLPYEPQADREPDPTRKRPFMFRRNPAMPGARMGPNGRPRDFGFIREQLGRLTRSMQPGGPVAGPVAAGAAAGEQFVRPMRPPVGPSLGAAASEAMPGIRPPQPAPTDRLPGLPGWQNIQASAEKTLPGPSPDGGPQFDAAAEELKKRMVETDTGLPPGQMF